LFRQRCAQRLLQLGAYIVTGFNLLYFICIT
jgi:hypothetical protein